MGMDLLDLAFRIERECGTRISHDDWADLVVDGDISTRDLYELVLSRNQLQESFRTDIGLNEQLWRRVQSAIAAAVGQPATEVQLCYSLDAVFQSNDYRPYWKSVQANSGLRMPQLRFNPWLETLTHVSVVLVVAACCLLVPVIGWAILSLAWLYILAVSSAAYAANHQRSRCPLRTVKDLYRAIRDSNTVRLKSMCGELVHDAEVWEQIRSCLIDTLGVDDDEVTLDALLIRDLGCD